MTFYLVVNNTEENRNSVRFLKFWLEWGPHQDVIYSLGEVGSGSQIAAIEFKDKAYSTPEDLPNSGATVSGDNTDEIMILDEKLFIHVVRFHWHQKDGIPIGPFEVVQTIKLFTATGAAMIEEKNLIEKIRDLNER